MSTRLTGRGVVVAPQPRACDVGADVLARGGNAFDAAVATAFAQGIDDPFMCGIGGMGTANLFHAASGAHVVLEFQARGGSRCTPDMYVRNLRGRAALGRATVHNDYSSELGYRSIMTPGAVAGFGEIHRRFGSMPWAELVMPAARLARDGMWVMPHAVEFWTRKPQAGLADGRSRLAATEESRAIYLRRDGGFFDVGDRVPNPGLADTLEAIARGGWQEFYAGGIGERIARDLEVHDAWITGEDLRGYRVREQQPVSIRYRGCDVRSAPPPVSGVTVLAILRIVEQFDLRALGHNSAACLNVLARAMAIAHADRYRYLCDPFVNRVDVDTLLSDAAAREAADSIRRATPPPVTAPSRDGGTTQVSVMDALGNAVSMTHTLGTASGVITAGLGFMYNNSMKLFDPDPAHPNAPAPGKTRGTAMAPTIVLRDGRPWIAVGAPGGSAIVSSVTQTLINLIDFGMSPTEAVSAPRIHCEGGDVFAEARIQASTLAALQAHGLVVQRRPYSYDPTFSRAQALVADGERGWRAGSDPRTGSGGCAVG